MLRMKPVRNENYNCFQNVVATLAGYLERDYVYMFTDQWGFQFDAHSDTDKYTIGQRLKPGWRGTTKELLDKYHGIVMTWHLDIDHDYVVKMAQEEVDFRRPVVVYIDAFVCPWTPAFNKYRTEHILIVIGVDMDSLNLICMDPYYSDSVQYLSNEIYENQIHKCCSINVKDDVSCFHWQEVLKENISKPYTSDNNFTMMREFAEEVMEKLDIDFELRNHVDMMGAPLLKELKEIEIARYNFSFLLETISNRFDHPDLKTFSQKMFEAGVLWNKIRMLLMRLALIPNKDKHLHSIASKIKEAANREENLAAELITICNNKLKTSGC